MRRLLPFLVLALTGSLTLVGPSASAMPVPLEPGAAAQAEPSVRCGTGLVGAGSDGRVRSLGFTNARLKVSLVTRRELKSDVTAWGLYSQNDDGLTLAAVTSSGRPELITLKRTKQRLAIARVRKLDQRGFTPPVFTDGYSFFAYTVGGDSLQRWTLTRDQRGRIRYVGPQRIASGFGDATAITSGGIRDIGKVPTEILYLTRTDGSMSQVRVGVTKGKPRVRTLQIASTGYAGVTELAWSVCVKPRGAASLIAVVPSEDRATWTTVARVSTKPRATLRGDMEGEVDWSLITAAY